MNLPHPAPNVISNFEFENMARSQWKYQNKEVQAHELTVAGIPIRRAPFELSESIEIVDPEPMTDVELYLDNWKQGKDMLNIAEEIWPAYHRPRRPPTSQGGFCGSYFAKSVSSTPIAIYTSLDDTSGAAENLVHEAGHLRLHALGIHLEEHDGRIITNRPDELFSSPVRKDKPRPMSAVLHAQYSYVMVLSLDEALASRGFDLILNRLKINYARIKEGMETIHINARWTEEGEAWRDYLFHWMRTVVEQAEVYV